MRSLWLGRLCRHFVECIRAIKAIGNVVQDQDHAIEVQKAHTATLPPLDAVPCSVGEEELAFRRLLDARTRADRLDL
jgi:hypothetical protein